jgi:hypothetical protein
MTVVPAESWHLRHGDAKPHRADEWKILYERHPDFVFLLCDEIVRNRPVPKRLLQRLQITTAAEKRMRGK